MSRLALASQSLTNLLCVPALRTRSSSQTYLYSDRFTLRIVCKVGRFLESEEPASLKSEAKNLPETSLQSEEKNLPESKKERRSKTHQAIEEGEEGEHGDDHDADGSGNEGYLDEDKQTHKQKRKNKLKLLKKKTEETEVEETLERREKMVT